MSSAAALTTSAFPGDSSSARRMDRQPEIQHLDPTVVRHHDVRRLEIPVHNPLLVCRHERVRQREGYFEGLHQGQTAAGQEPVEALAVQVLHGQKLNAGDFFNGIERDDVRVVQGCDHPGLALETRQPFGVASQILGQHLERHVATPLPSPCSERSEDLVGAETSAGSQWHWGKGWVESAPHRAAAIPGQRARRTGLGRALGYTVP